MSSPAPSKHQGILAHPGLVATVITIVIIVAFLGALYNVAHHAGAAAGGHH